MIKLNNKNITYVALADSNNSLKAPKEIWYADSSNSVKLVYRRKDALIEGEDYEKYHWLVSDGDCYIDTATKYRPYSDSIDLITKDNLYPNRATNLNKYNQEEFMFGYYSIEAIIVCAYIPIVLKVGVNVLKYNSSNQPDWITYCVPTNVNSNSIHNIHLNKVTDNKYSFEYNGTTFNDRTTVLEFPSNYECQGFLYLFNLNNPTTLKHYFNGAFNTYIHYRDDIAIQNLIPCKLLKPVPKWLDANGIRRNIGECGMIDLVSGKFYGNVNSVGTFTVENYYEKKNYLKCSDGSYMLYQNFDVTSNIVNGNWVKFGTTEYLGEEYFLYGLIRTGWLCACYISENKLLLCNHIAGESYTSLWKYDLSTLNSHDNVAIQLKTEQVSSPTKYVSRSSIVFSDNYTLAPQNDNWFYNTVWGNTVCDLKISTPNGYILSNCNITQNNDNVISSLIPCTLTMDLPASMDANNIARTKGTSGMWDLVSDRFYGNVANSGTFKAVNLAEGVDYEVHQWLKLEETTIRTERYYYISISLSSLNFSFRKIFLNDFHNTHYFYSDNYSYYTDNYLNNVWNRSAGNQLYRGTHSFYINTPIEISSSANKQVILGEEIIEIPDYTNPVFVIDGNRGYNPLQSLTSAVTVDGIERYIPVKLLRSLPSKYDANGIARQAGECGMYDTVNDVFYGNVASSGTFSVKDDS